MSLISTSESVVSQIPGLDLNDALYRLNQNMKLLITLLHSFQEDFSDVIPCLREMVTQGDLVAAQDLAHSLKGAAANLGLTDVMALAKAVEYALRDEDIAQGSIRLDTLEQELQSVLDAIVRLPGEALTPLPDEFLPGSLKR